MQHRIETWPQFIPLPQSPSSCFRVLLLPARAPMLGFCMPTSSRTSLSCYVATMPVPRSAAARKPLPRLGAREPGLWPFATSCFMPSLWPAARLLPRRVVESGRSRLVLVIPSTPALLCPPPSSPAVLAACPDAVDSGACR